MANTLIKVNLGNCLRSINFSRTFSISILQRSNKVPEEALPKNTIQDYIGENLQPKGAIYDKRPFKLNLKANKQYFWCSCGQSKSQPLCDGTHKLKPLKITHVPVPFMVEETKEYWLCNCKQTDHPPFCDGTHKKEEIQSSMKYYKM